MGGWWPHRDSQQNMSPTCQNEQLHCYAKGTNCLSLKIVVSLSKPASITFLAPVCEKCSLFFLQAQFFLNNTLVIEESKHQLSDPWLLPAKLLWAFMMILFYIWRHTYWKQKWKLEVTKRCQQFTMFTPEKAKKAQTGGRGIALLSL